MSTRNIKIDQRHVNWVIKSALRQIFQDSRDEVVVGVIRDILISKLQHCTCVSVDLSPITPSVFT